MHLPESGGGAWMALPHQLVEPLNTFCQRYPVASKWPGTIAGPSYEKYHAPSAAAELFAARMNSVYASSFVCSIGHGIDIAEAAERISSQRTRMTK